MQPASERRALSGADMGMSYKREWLLLDSMNQAFTEPIVTAAPAGRAAAGRR